MDGLIQTLNMHITPPMPSVKVTTEITNWCVSCVQAFLDELQLTQIYHVVYCQSINQSINRCFQMSLRKKEDSLQMVKIRDGRL